jgi:hypothetical protein
MQNTTTPQSPRFESLKPIALPHLTPAEAAIARSLSDVKPSETYFTLAPAPAAANKNIVSENTLAFRVKCKLTNLVRALKNVLPKFGK